MARGGLFAAGLVACAAAIASGACAPAAPYDSGGDQEMSQSDADAIASALLIEASNGTTTVGKQTFDFDESVHPLANCSPQHLTPKRTCAAGGNVYSTTNATCPDPNVGACCAANPACAQWKAGISGQVKTLFNDCRPSADTLWTGTLNATMTGTIVGSCNGQASAGVKIVFNGSFTVRVNGQDVCPGGVSLTVNVSVTDRVVSSAFGTVCGRSVNLRTT